MKKPRIKHGLSSHPIYFIFKNMKLRCYYKKHQSYKNYGGRGIKICDEWLSDIRKFYSFCVENGWRKNLQIDRKNNNGDYTPENCRFVTRSINNINKRLSNKSTTGFIGVSYKKDKKKFKAYLSINKKQIHIGYFKSASLAAKARNSFIIKNNHYHRINYVY